MENLPIRRKRVVTEKFRGKKLDWVEIPNFGWCEVNHENEQAVIALLETFDKRDISWKV